MHVDLVIGHPLLHGYWWPSEWIRTGAERWDDQSARATGKGRNEESEAGA
jgi:hypothetical protein